MLSASSGLARTRPKELRSAAGSWDAFVYAVEGYLQGDEPRVKVVLGRVSDLAK
jgi:hypothetical protein